MTKRAKHNIGTLLIYSACIYILLIGITITYNLWLPMIGVSLMLGFFAGIGNDVIVQLRKLNGEKFPNLEEEKTE